MENKEINQLIETFKEYRDLLTPIQKNLKDFIETYQTTKESIELLSQAFEGDVKARLDEIFKQMTEQANKTAGLTTRIDQLTESANNYATQTSGLISTFSRIEEKIKSVNELEKKAQNQLAKLDDIIEEKAKSYNIKQLTSSLEAYEQDAKKVSPRAIIATNISLFVIN